MVRARTIIDCKDRLMIRCRSSFLSHVLRRHVDMTVTGIAFDLFDIILDCVSRGNDQDADVQPDVRSRRTLNGHGDRKYAQAKIEA